MKRRSHEVFKVGLLRRECAEDLVGVEGYPWFRGCDISYPRHNVKITPGIEDRYEDDVRGSESHGKFKQQKLVSVVYFITKSTVIKVRLGVDFTNKLRTCPRDSKNVWLVLS